MSTKRFMPQDGYMYYTNLGDYGAEQYWNMIKRSAEGYFSGVQAPKEEAQTVSQYLRQMGLAEQAREIAVLNQFFGTDLTINSATDFSTVLLAMNKALGWGQDLQHIAFGLFEDSNALNDRALYLNANYSQWLVTAISDVVESRLASNDSILEIFSNSKNGFQAVVGEAVDLAFVQMFDSNPAVLREISDSAPWQELDGVMSEMNTIRDLLKQEVYTKFNFKRMQSEVRKQKAVLDAHKKGHARRDTFRGALHSITTRGASALNKGGFNSVNDLAGEIGGEFATRMNLGLGGGEFNWKIETPGSSGRNVFSTDKAIVIQAASVEGEIDLPSMIANDKVQASRAMKEFAEQVRAQQGDAAIIYESTKLYNLGKNFSRFHGSQFSAESAISLLESIDVPQARQLILKVGNTARGALYGKGGRAFRQEVEKSLAKYVAYFLFDSWGEIGTQVSNVNAIHVFRLSGIVIPLSWLLLRMADAIDKAVENIDRYVKVRFNIDSVRSGGGNVSNLYAHLYKSGKLDTSQAASSERWEEQRSELLSLTLNIEFLSNFKSLLSADIAGWYNSF